MPSIGDVQGNRGAWWAGCRIRESRGALGWKGSKNHLGWMRMQLSRGWSLKSLISCISCGNDGLQAAPGALGIKKKSPLKYHWGKKTKKTLKNQPLAAEAPWMIPGKQLPQDLLILPKTQLALTLSRPSLPFHSAVSFPRRLSSSSSSLEPGVN